MMCGGGRCSGVGERVQHSFGSIQMRSETLDGMDKAFSGDSLGQLQQDQM